MKVLTENMFTDMYIEESIIKVFGKEDGNLLLNEIESMEYEVAEDENCDNYRVVLVGNKDAEALYDDAVNNGCCGSEDREVMVNGKLYRIGFNFGN